MFEDFDKDGLEHVSAHEPTILLLDLVEAIEVQVRYVPDVLAQMLSGALEALGPDRTAKLKVVTVDMSAAYVKAVEDRAPQAKIVFDRFHVQRLVQDAVDQVRRAEVRALETQAERR